MSTIFLAALLGLSLGILLTYALMTRKLALLQAKLDTAQERNSQEQEYLTKIEEQFQASFENLAQEILEHKSANLVQQNQVQIQNLLNPLRERILEFQTKVESTHQESMIQIGYLEKLGLSMSKEAERLATALKGEVQTQGTWGEMILERILEASGLRPGHEFILQGQGLDLKNEQGGRLKPDVVIVLPEERHLIIDSKVSLVAYERYLASSEPKDREQAKKELVRSLKKHVEDLKSRHYDQVKSLNSPDFVLIFMPLEPAYALALQTEPELFQYAWDRKIIITTPTTLMATLWIIANIWQQAHQTANALEIARQGAALYDKFVGFIDSLEEVGRQLTRSQNAYDRAFNQLKTGRGNLITRSENLRDLGLSTTKSLNEELLSEALKDA